MMFLWGDWRREKWRDMGKWKGDLHVYFGDDIVSVKQISSHSDYDYKG